MGICGKYLYKESKRLLIPVKKTRGKLGFRDLQINDSDIFFNFRYFS